MENSPLALHRERDSENEVEIFEIDIFCVFLLGGLSGVYLLIISGGRGYLSPAFLWQATD